MTYEIREGGVVLTRVRISLLNMIALILQFMVACFLIGAVPFLLLVLPAFFLGGNVQEVFKTINSQLEQAQRQETPPLPAPSSP